MLVARHWVKGELASALEAVGKAISSAAPCVAQAGGVPSAGLVASCPASAGADMGAAASPDAPPEALYAARLSLLHDLGWSHMLRHEELWAALRSTHGRAKL